MKNYSIFFVAALALAACAPKAPAPLSVLPTPSQVEWQKMEMNMFVHFGPNTFTSREWGNGQEDPDVFNPTDLDCRQWVRTAKAAGFKGVIITAKHHDGFCLWPNPVSGHTVAQSSWRDGKGDVLRELSDACREYGLKFGVYVSPWDRNDPHYGTDEYNDVFCKTLKSALGSYGHVFEQWFDGACGEGPNGKRQVYDWKKFRGEVYKHQPHAIIFSNVGPGCRWVGNEDGKAGATSWGYLDTLGYSPSICPPLDSLNCGNVHGSTWIPAETDVSIRPGWFYRDSENGRVKSVSELLEIYYASVGRNSLLLLNVPADTRGHLCEVDSLRLMEFRTALDGIFGVNFADGATVSATSWRGSNTSLRGAQRRGNLKYAPANILNGKYDSYWATDDDVTSASFTMTLDGEKTFNRVMVQEYIPLGQRISKFNVEALTGDEWTEIATGTTIGYKRILLTDKVTASAVRINILSSYACPIINGFGLYLDEFLLESPVITRNKAGVVSITAAPGAEIRYNLGTAEPTEDSPVYKAPVKFPAAGCVRAIALLDGRKSEIRTRWFDIAPASFKVLAPAGASAIADGLSDEEHSAVIPASAPVVMDLGRTIDLKGFSYEPLAGGKGGCIMDYRFETSLDGRTWKTVAEDSIDNIVNNPTARDIRFPAPSRAHYIRLTVLRSSSADSVGIAELGVVTR